MPALLFNIAGTTVINIIQLISGCVLAVFFFRIFKSRPMCKVQSSKFSFAFIFTFSLIGILLPLGIYGIIPLIAAMLAVGFGSHTAGALLVSNVLFNMLVPFNDPSFVWRSGYRQVLLAFAAGLGAGIILYAGKVLNSKILRQKYMPSIREHSSNIRMFLMIIDDSIKKLGVFLVFGAIAEAIFQKYLLSNIVNAFYYNSFTAAIPTFFGRHDVSNPLFLLTFTIIYMLMNMINLFALAAIFKFRGLVSYFGYYLLLAVILAIPAFI